ncbi:glycosyl hydrolase-related protein [Paenibacillus sp. Soil766]|uniref:glycosyl hydrolase-related protein n=1 Tax=Paenibacillus sp. Soil766 TaxID=1736404 RepID=UPI00138F8E28|nr:glycosyl hydrolase-related protein [Paenibacillus sp. Soil766]
MDSQGQHVNPCESCESFGYESEGLFAALARGLRGAFSYSTSGCGSPSQQRVRYKNSIFTDSDALIVRLHEFTGSRHRVTLTSDYAVKTWQECNLMERPFGEMNQGDTIELSIKPFEICTFKVTL